MSEEMTISKQYSYAWTSRALARLSWCHRKECNDMTLSARSVAGVDYTL